VQLIYFAKNRTVAPHNSADIRHALAEATRHISQPVTSLATVTEGQKQAAPKIVERDVVTNRKSSQSDYRHSAHQGAPLSSKIPLGQTFGPSDNVANFGDTFHPPPESRDCRQKQVNQRTETAPSYHQSGGAGFQMGTNGATPTSSIFDEIFTF
jgi:hypothetical protein